MRQAPNAAAFFSGLVSFAGLAVVMVVASPGGKVSAQTAPTFECNGTIYIAHSNPNTQLTRLDVDKNPITMTNIGSPFAQGYNAVGFNFNDGYLYGYNHRDEVYVRVAADGSATAIGTPTGMPTGAPQYLAGDFDANGRHNMLAANNTPPYEWVITDVSTSPPTRVGSFTIDNDLTGNMTFGDIAYNPKDGKFYGMDTITHRVVMFSIDPSGTSGTVTHLSTDNSAQMVSGANGLHGGAVIDAKGDLLSTQLNPGKLFRSNIGVNGSGTGAATFLNDVPTVEMYDGASCPYAPKLEKNASPRTVKAGAQVTYTYTLYNALTSGPITFDFSDTLTDGRTFVADTLDNAHSGTADSYGGKNTITVTGMTVPSSSSVTFSVKVQIPADAPAKTMENQAIARNFSVASFPDELRSDDPTTVIVDDPTKITVEAGTPPVVPDTPDTGFGVITSKPLLFGGILSVIALGLVWLARRSQAGGQTIR